MENTRRHMRGDADHDTSICLSVRPSVRPLSTKKRGSDFPLLSHLCQRLWENPKEFPGQTRNIVSSSCPESFLRQSPPGWTRPPGRRPGGILARCPSHLNWLLLEKVVAKQLTAALNEYNIYDSFQSGFRRAHSTETALFRVSNDLLTHSDAGDCSVLVLLDLTAAFDTVDHHLLLERLRDWVGLSGTALEWLSSYLSEHSFSVAVSKFRSSTTSLTHGVPQGSVLGPLLFLLYLLPLQHILSSFKGISYHLYADDIQLYISFKPHEMSKLQLLHTCLDSIETWMAGSFLQMNEDKTEILICAPDKLVPKVRDSLGQLASHTKPSVRNLGVTFDPALTLDSHVSSPVRSSFFHLRNIAKLSPILSRSELETFLHTFISSRLDYCNSLFTCLSRTSLNRLQVVQNACARLLTKSSKHTHITPLLLQLHWLPVNFRVHFKILVLVYRALHGQAPSYILFPTPPAGP
uniref:Reverse transcriptase domain-containing protein n=1 Tax=Nothobranchius furzeri TaxID=105023 RepID=A0A8C6KCT2_NOTFU